MPTHHIHILQRDNRSRKHGKKAIDVWVWAKTLTRMQGFWVGPEISNRLKLYFGPENVATEGVNYLGRIDTNFMEGGAPPGGILLMQQLLTLAATNCPFSVIVVAGYRYDLYSSSLRSLSIPLLQNFLWEMS